MKKILLLLAVSLLTMPMMAQTDGSDDAPQGNGDLRKNAFYIGPRFGLSFNSMTDPAEGALYDKSDIGFSAGVTLRARFGKAADGVPAGTGLLGIGLDANYTQNKVKTHAVDDEGNENAAFSMNYFEVPVFVQLYPFYKSDALNTLYVELGAAVAGTVGRSPQSLTLNGLEGELSSVTYNIGTDNSKLKGMDIRPLVGVGYTVPGVGFDLNARYYLGTSDLSKNFNCKLSRFEVSLAWMFKAVF